MKGGIQMDVMSNTQIVIAVLGILGSLVAAALGPFATAWFSSSKTSRGDNEKPSKLKFIALSLTMAGVVLGLTGFLMSLVALSEARLPKFEVVTDSVALYTSGYNPEKLALTQRHKISDTDGNQVPYYLKSLNVPDEFEIITTWVTTSVRSPAEVLHDLTTSFDSNGASVTARSKRKKEGYAYVTVYALCQRR